MPLPSLLLAAVLSCACALAPACRLRSIVGQWPPYTYGTVQRPAGLDIELAQAILREAGCELVFVEDFPTLRRDQQFRDGRIDLLMAASDTAERRASARLSLPYRIETVRLYTARARRDKFLSLRSFDAIVSAGHALLAPNSGWYGPAYAQVQETLRKQGRLHTFGSFAQGVRMLAAGRAELILGDAAALHYAALQAGVDMVALPYVVLNAPVHIMLNRANTSDDDLQRINAAIERLELNGALRAIRARYESS